MNAAAGRVARLAGLLLAVAMMGARATAEPAAHVSFEEITRRVSEVNPTLQSFIAKQLVDIRIFGFIRLSLRGTLYAARPAIYRIVLHDPPAFLRGFGTVFGDATSPERVLAEYRPRAIRPVDGDRVAVELVARRPDTNPPQGRIVVDTTRWLIVELAGQYAWGTVEARYEYGLIGDYQLPTSARVAVAGFPVTADLTYSDYQLNVPLPPDIFDEQASSGP